MLGTLKQKVRKQIENKYNARYREECKDKIYTYEKWLEEYRTEGKGLYKESEYRNIKKKCSLISWSRLENISDFSELKLQDIVILVQDEKGLLKDAIEKISAVFVNRPEVSVVYGDEDEINAEDNERRNPWFKPDYSPDTLVSYFYLGSLVAFRKEALKSVVFEKDWSVKEKLYAVTLQVCLPLNRKQVWHYRDMLYTSTAISYWGWEEDYKKIKERFGDVRPKAKEDGVSIIIPSKDNPKVLERCLESIVKLTEGVKYEIVVIDNGSNEENKAYIEKMKDKLGFNYIYNPMEFNFSHMCNEGASHGNYGMLLFLNDDCEVRHSDWLRRLTNQALVLDTGAVGAKLHYPDSKIMQHCGIYSLQVGPAHKLQFKEDTCAYYDRRNLDVRNVIAATGACLMMRRDIFEEVGGFDEGLRVAFNDVDLCYKIYEAGYNNVIDNNVQLWHHESLSRGSDNSPEKMGRHMAEREGLYQRHPKLWGHDPYYHPGLTSYYLDVNYSFAYEYVTESIRKRYQFENYSKLKELPKKIREDNCLVPMIEFAGDIKQWHIVGEDVAELLNDMYSENIAYFQGNMVVLGSNNACYKKSIVLRHEESGQLYVIEPAKKYRPDIDNNLPDQENVGLSGFAFLLNLKDMPTGSYEISVMAKDMISGQYLYRKTPVRMENKL